MNKLDKVVENFSIVKNDTQLSNLKRLGPLLVQTIVESLSKFADEK